MRTISAAETAILGLDKRSSWVRVRIDDGTATFTDFTTLEGRDWVKQVTVDDSIDSRGQTARVDLWREVYDLSIAPGVASDLNTPNQLIDVGRRIDVEFQLRSQDDTPSAAGWEILFSGYIDVIDWGSNKSAVKLQCRDLGAVLRDRWIEQQTIYPDPNVYPAGRPLEGLIQDILDDWVTSPDTAPTLYTPSAPGLVVTPAYIQDKMSVENAIERLAGDTIGWDVRYKWDNGTNAYRLTLFEPDRTQTTPDHTFDQDQYFDLASVEANRQNVRNVVRVNYDSGGTAAADITNLARASNLATVTTSAAHGYLPGQQVQINAFTGPASVDVYDNNEAVVLAASTTTTFTYENVGLDQGSTASTGIVFAKRINSVEVEDSASVTKYGRRFMSITEASTSQIDTAAEAETLANAILDDLKEPDVPISAELPLFPFVQLGDLYRFSANGRHFDQDQDGAVLSWRHVYTPKRSRTTLKVTGKPRARVKRWLKLQEIPGLTPFVDQKPPAKPENLTCVGTRGGAELTYDTPTELDWAATFLYIDGPYDITTPPTNPSDFNIDGTTPAQIGRTDRFVLTDLDPDKRYLFKVVVFDLNNNRSPESDVEICDTLSDGIAYKAEMIAAQVIDPVGNVTVTEVIEYDDEIFDVGRVYNDVLFEFKAPYDGFFQFEGQIRAIYASNGDEGNVEFFKNGVAAADWFPVVYASAGAGDSNTFKGIYEVLLTAGDTVDARFTYDPQKANPSDVTLTVTDPGEPLDSFFKGTLIAKT